jgi:hypothetical protein
MEESKWISDLVPENKFLNSHSEIHSVAKATEKHTKEKEI